MYRSPHSYISLTKLISCSQGREGLGVQSTGCTFGPLVTPSVFCLRTVSELTDVCSAWVCKLVPEVDRCECLRRPSSITGGCELGNDYFCLVFLAGTILRCILHSCSISSGSHPNSQKVSFLPSLTLPTSSFCVPGTISKISSLYSVLRVSSYGQYS